MRVRHLVHQTPGPTPRTGPPGSATPAAPTPPPTPPTAPRPEAPRPPGNSAAHPSPAPAPPTPPPSPPPNTRPGPPAPDPTTTGHVHRGQPPPEPRHRRRPRRHRSHPQRAPPARRPCPAPRQRHCRTAGPAHGIRHAVATPLRRNRTRVHDPATERSPIHELIVRMSTDSTPPAKVSCGQPRSRTRPVDNRIRGDRASAVTRPHPARPGPARPRPGRPPAGTQPQRLA